MAGRLRTFFLIAACAAAAHAQRAAVAAPRDSTARKTDSLVHAAVPAGPRDVRGADSTSRLPLPALRDSLALGDSGRRDSARGDSAAAPLVYRWVTPFADAEDCPDGRETATGCWRNHAGVSAQETGFPGTRAWTLSLTEWERLALQSPYSPAGFRSQYLSGGVAPPERFALRKLGGSIVGIDEVWSPVTPLDTPITELDWERGALALNVFHLKLKRMLSDRAYLGLEFYSASGDSATFDYQFNVHQPYLAGWGFLGKIYPPIDRDSTSIVLTGVSHQISALDFRPRIGFWLDTGQVIEAYLSRIKNVTSMVMPLDRIDTINHVVPMPIQIPIQSGFAGYTGGAIYGLRGDGWTSQWEAGVSSLQKAMVRGDSLINEELTGNVARLRGAWSAPGWILRPTAEVEGISEAWQGKPVLGPRLGAQGWTDRESGDLGLAPEWSFAELRGDAGVSRVSRMDGSEHWLGRYGAYGRLKLPFGFGADAGASYRERDPDWELLHRFNAAASLNPNPSLGPRSDLGLRGSASWSIPHVTLEAGVNLLQGENVWLPYVLPQPGACADLGKSLYRYAGGPVCDTAGSAPRLSDSLALRLRNYARENLDSWHLGIGLALGHWALRIENHFMFAAQVEDPDLFEPQDDRAVPERVFKGQLRWRRALVDGKMRLDLRWDWEWYSTRYAWASDLAGMSQVVKLDEYLALDFEANMYIKTFDLYFKAMNFNHDRYFTEAGVHPPGLNFRFGVDWTLFN
jgi:hypothetical protein